MMMDDEFEDIQQEDDSVEIKFGEHSSKGSCKMIYTMPLEWESKPLHFL